MDVVLLWLVISVILIFAMRKHWPEDPVDPGAYKAFYERFVEDRTKKNKWTLPTRSRKGRRRTNYPNIQSVMHSHGVRSNIRKRYLGRRRYP